MKAIQLLLLILIPQLAASQQMYMRRINTEGEIPAHEIYHVFQDSEKCIWFASDAGVWRYDGKEYKGFTAAEGLPDNVAFGFFEDNKKRLWLKLYTNQVAYIQNEKVTVLPCSNLLSQMKNFELISSMCVENDTVYISYMRSDEIVKISPPYKNENIEFIQVNTETAFYIYETPQKNILFGLVADMPVFMYSISVIKKGGTTKVPFKGEYLNTPRIMCAPQHKGRYLIGASNLLFEYNNGKLKELIKFNNPILYAIYDHQENLWVATTDAGLKFYDKNDKYFQHPVTYFKNDFANCILQDNENSYWIATLKSGLYYAPFNDVMLLNQQNNLSKNISCTYYDKSRDKVYAFGMGNMYILKHDTLVSKKDITLRPTEPNDIYKVLPLSKNELVCLGRQSFIYNLLKDEITPIHTYTYGKKISLRSTTGAFTGDTLYCAAQHFLMAMNKNALIAEPIKNLESRINAIHILNGKNLLIGTERGIFFYHIYSGKINRLSFMPQGISVNSIVHSPQHKSLFIILKNGRIFILDDKATKILRTSEAVTGISIRKSFIDETGNIWLSSNKGIFYIDENFRFHPIDKERGLPTNLINHITVNHQKVYAASEEGLIIFPRNKKFTNTTPPYLKCTGIKINGVNVPLKKHYELSHNENFIKIGYNAINYRTNSNVICKYRLKGLDNNWQYTQNQTIEFTTLPPGNYEFELFVLNNDKVRSNNSISFSFVIHKPFWKTWWFILLLTIIFLGLIFLIFTLRIRQVKKREAEKNALNRKLGETKLLALSSQMHPHFVFNSINSIQHYILANEPLKANKYLTKFSKLMRNVLEQSRKEQITLEEELETVNLYLEMESLRFEDSFDHKIILKTGFPPDMFLVPSLIIQPIVENAIWHGLLLKKGEKKLTITAYIENYFLFIAVDDNGIGRDEAKKYNKSLLKKDSLGLKIIQERLILLENLVPSSTHIEITDKFEGEFSTGTTVTIKIPIIKNSIA